MAHVLNQTALYELSKEFQSIGIYPKLHYDTVLQGRQPSGNRQSLCWSLLTYGKYKLPCISFLELTYFFIFKQNFDVELWNGVSPLKMIAYWSHYSTRLKSLSETREDVRFKMFYFGEYFLARSTTVIGLLQKKTLSELQKHLDQ